MGLPVADGTHTITPPPPTIHAATTTSAAAAATTYQQQSLDASPVGGLTVGGGDGMDEDLSGPVLARPSECLGA